MFRLLALAATTAARPENATAYFAAANALWPPASATYSIGGWLGSGTFGAVFKARRRSTHGRSSSVAVKVIPRYSYASSRELEVMKILREKPHVAVMQLLECFSVASTESSTARILPCLVLPLYDSCLRM